MRATPLYQHTVTHAHALCLLTYMNSHSAQHPHRTHRCPMHQRVQPSLYVHQAHSTLLCCLKPSQLDRLRTARVMLNASWPTLLAVLSFLLTTNLFVFSDILAEHPRGWPVPAKTIPFSGACKPTPRVLSALSACRAQMLPPPLQALMPVVPVVRS
jgi:hypothetical protein